MNKIRVKGGGLKDECREGRMGQVLRKDKKGQNIGTTIGLLH